MAHFTIDTARPKRYLEFTVRTFSAEPSGDAGSASPISYE